MVLFVGPIRKHLPKPSQTKRSKMLICRIIIHRTAKIVYPENSARFRSRFSRPFRASFRLGDHLVRHLFHHNSSDKDPKKSKQSLKAGINARGPAVHFKGPKKGSCYPIFWTLLYFNPGHFGPLKWTAGPLALISAFRDCLLFLGSLSDELW